MRKGKKNSNILKVSKKNKKELIKEEEINNINKIEYNKVILMYEYALKTLRTKLEILNDQFKEICDYNPIDHINYRIKSPKSIVNKMNKKNLEINNINMVNNINDIAGIRIVCSFKKDVYQIVDILKSYQDIEIIKEKDYIKNPKTSGYQSYHMIVNVPVVIIDKIVYVKVEIQIRSLAMDFWASLEHKLKYKGSVSQKDSRQLVKCANVISKVDDKMQLIKER